MFSGPLSGMTKAETLLDTTASRIANTARSLPNTEGVQMPADKVEITDEMTSLIQSLAAFEANSKALEAEASIAESTLRITV
jgi:flagellar basal body rod protein FlgC